MLRSLLWAALGFFVLSAASRGEDLASAPPTDFSAEKIATLVDQLTHPEFADRQAASQHLTDAGILALPQLEATAAAGSREAAARAFDILKRHFQSGGDELKAPAGEALQRLADSKTATTAQRARDVLNPPPPLTLAALQPQPQPPRFNFGGFGANGFGFRRVSVSDINGRKIVEIDERERNVRIESSAQDGIRVSVTDKQNPRNGVRTIVARDLDDLKRKDAELGRLYEQNLGGGARPLGVMGQFLPFGAAPPAAGGAPINPARQVEMIDRLLDLYKQRLPIDPAAQGMIDSLQRSKQRYQAQLPEGEIARNPR